MLLATPTPSFCFLLLPHCKGKQRACQDSQLTMQQSWLPASRSPLTALSICATPFPAAVVFGLPSRSLCSGRGGVGRQPCAGHACSQAALLLLEPDRSERILCENLNEARPEPIVEESLLDYDSQHVQVSDHWGMLGVIVPKMSHLQALMRCCNLCVQYHECKK